MSLLNDNRSIFNTDLEVNDHVKSILLNMASWTKFLAVFGFVIMGLMIAVLAIAGITKAGSGQMETAAQMGYYTGSMIGASALLVGIYFYPTYALLLFSSRIKKAFSSPSQEQFESALNYLKNSFKYIAILMIICVVLYGIALVFLALAAVKAGM